MRMINYRVLWRLFSFSLSHYMRVEVEHINLYLSIYLSIFIDILGRYWVEKTVCGELITTSTTATTNRLFFE